MPKYIFSSGDHDNPAGLHQDAYVGFYPEGIFDANAENHFLAGPVITLGGWFNDFEGIGPRKLTLKEVFARLGITCEICEGVFNENPTKEGLQSCENSEQSGRPKQP